MPEREGVTTLTDPERHEAVTEIADTIAPPNRAERRARERAARAGARRDFRAHLRAAGEDRE